MISKIQMLIRLLKVALMVLPVLLEAMKLLKDDVTHREDDSILSAKGVPPKKH